MNERLVNFLVDTAEFHRAEVDQLKGQVQNLKWELADGRAVNEALRLDITRLEGAVKLAGVRRSDPEVVEKMDEFFPHSKIPMIKWVRTRFDTGLKEAKDLVDRFWDEEQADHTEAVGDV